VIEKNGSPCKVYQTPILVLTGLRNMVADLESTWEGSIFYDEIAEMAAFMVSDDNSYMNGFTLVMDGGL
jgi:hypothetical protein